MILVTILIIIVKEEKENLINKADDAYVDRKYFRKDTIDNILVFVNVHL